MTNSDGNQQRNTIECAPGRHVIFSGPSQIPVYWGILMASPFVLVQDLPQAVFKTFVDIILLLLRRHGS